MGQVLTDIKGERFVDTITSGGKNRLCVDAELTVRDIQIGAVEIKDGDSDLRISVYNEGDTAETGFGIMGEDSSGQMQFLKVDSDGELIVNIGAADSDFVYSEVNLVKDVATTVVTESPGVTERYTGFSVSGFGLGRWDVQFGSTGSEVTFLTIRTTASNSTEYFAFPNPKQVDSGETLKIVGTNKETAGGPGSDFFGSATLFKEQ